MATIQRVEKTDDAVPHTKVRGHLALVDWSKASEQAVAASGQERAGVVRRTLIDKCYEHGVILLLLVTVLAVLASVASL